MDYNVYPYNKRNKRSRRRTSRPMLRLAPGAPPTFRDFCNRCTWHGFSDYQNAGPNLPLRIFWIMFISAAFCACATGCYKILAQYIQSPVVISYTVRRAESEAERALPDIVICLFNRFNQSVVDQYQITDDLLEYIQTAFSFTTPYKFQREQPHLPKNHTEFENELQNLTNNMGNITFGELIDRLSFKCEDIIEYCALPGGRIYNCCTDSVSVITPIGKCFRIIGQPQVSSGFSFGMTLIIKLPEQRFLSRGISNLHNHGVSVKLAEKAKGLDYDLTFLPSGVHALMPLRATRYKFMNKPRSYECQVNVEASFSEIQCFDDCLFQPGVDHCHCRHIASQNTTFQPCTPHEFYHCLIPVFVGELQKVGANEYVENCHNFCKPPCSYWRFQPTVSYSYFPASTLSFYSSHVENFKDTILLDVFFERLEYTLIEHLDSMSVQEFIANVGGQLGLWVGGSILSILQLLTFLIHYFYAKLYTRKWKQYQQSIVRDTSRRQCSVAEEIGFNSVNGCQTQA